MYKTFEDALNEAKVNMAKDESDARNAEELIQKLLKSKHVNSTVSSNGGVIGKVKTTGKHKIEYTYSRGFFTVYVNGDEKYEEHAVSVQKGVDELSKWIDKEKLY